MKVRQKSPILEAITFDEFVAHGLAHGATVVNGMPWSFKYEGFPVTHENDDCYLIQTPHGQGRFNRGEMLVNGGPAGLRTVTALALLAEYEPVETVDPTALADLARRDLLNQILACNPDVARKLHDCRAEGGAFNNPEGKLPFDVVFWVGEVAERLGIEPVET